MRLLTLLWEGFRGVGKKIGIILCDAALPSAGADFSSPKSKPPYKGISRLAMILHEECTESHLLLSKNDLAT